MVRREGKDAKGAMRVVGILAPILGGGVRRMSRIIEIIVSPDGQTRMETNGYAGQECREASKLVEQALGRRAEEQVTAEFHN